MNTPNHALFSASEMLEFAWGKTKENLRPLLIIGCTSALLALLNSASSNTHKGGVDLLNLVVQFCQVAITMAWIRTALKIADGKPADVPRAKELWPDYFMFLLSSILVGIVVALGLVALIFPGVWLGLTFAFAGFSVLDRKMDPIEAMRESARLTRGVKGELFGLAVVLLLLNFAGALALGLGLLITVPMSFIAAAQVYRRLQEVAIAAPQPSHPVPAH